MLGSVMHTALSGISAAELGLAVTAHNVANSLTDGFKASRPVFSERTPVTFGGGSQSSGLYGGQNPTQIGQGVYVSAIRTDTTPGPLAYREANSFGTDTSSTSSSSSSAVPSATSSEYRELSNTNIVDEIVNMSLYETMFRANVRVLETGDQMLGELLALRRS